MRIEISMKSEHPLFKEKIENLLKTHRKKSEEYGLENLNKMGASYMVARIIDKSGRLEGFLKCRLSLEHLKEELNDIAVCAILALCLIDENKTPIYRFEELPEESA